MSSPNSVSTRGEVLFATFTGKAALVLRKKGSPCRTIHNLIYRVSEASELEIARARKKLEALEAEAVNLTGFVERMQAEAQIQALRAEIKETKRPRFSLNEQSDLRDAKLLVLDEVSMVGPEMAADLLSFKKPILVIGDPGQLPPIKGLGAFSRSKSLT